MQEVGPRLAYSEQLHAEKYRLKGETFRDAMGRVAASLTHGDNSSRYHEFREVLLDMRFMPAGRVQAAMGSPKAVTPYNCLSGDTEVLTLNGYARLDQHVGKTLFVMSPVSGHPEEAVVKSYGEQQLYEVTIGNSSLGQRRAGTFSVMATKNHRWVLQDGVVCDALQVGDLLKAGSSDVKASASGFMHGLVFGDGTKQREGKFAIRLCGKKARHLPLIMEAHPEARVTYPQSLCGDPFVTIDADDRELVGDLKALPADTLGPQYLRGFVEGLLAADGCFSTRGNDPFQFHGTEETVRWMRDYMVLADYAPCGRAYACDSSPTNYGPRSVSLWKQVFRRTSDHKGFRVLSIEPVGAPQLVYCVEEPLYRQLILRNGLRTGNCYVSGTIPDSFVSRDNAEASSIMHRAEQAATTMRMGGGIGYDFSTLRPEGALIEKLQSRSSGPLGFMPIFNEVCKATSSAGNRRGAQMGVLRIDHPDAFKFVHAKHNQTALTGFNISLAVTHEFMEALDGGRTFALRFGGRVYQEVDAGEMWEALMRSTWDWAEPGVLFIDTINDWNNLWYCERIAATNPCGEQPLPPFGACLLGSFNLVKYLRKDLGGSYFDWDQLASDIPHVVRAMDNVVDRAIYPLPEQEHEAKAKRRMGLGVTGFANCAEAMGMPYGSKACLAFEDKLLAFITRHSYLASTVIAEEKGAFPLYDPKYLQSKFVRTLDADVVERIMRFGIRNSHLTSIAPTGTISMAADNVSSSIEPVYRWKQERAVFMDAGKQTVDLYDYGFSNLGVRGRRTSMGEVTAAEHVAVLTTAQRHVDSAVSKTVNCDGSMPWEDFKGIYLAAYRGGAKGCTTFNKHGKRAGLFKEAFEPADLPFPPQSGPAPIGGGADVGLTCEFDPATGRRSCE